MQSQVQKWGNSLALRIPKSFAKEANIEQGTTVEISVEAGKIIITPARPKYKLDDMLSGINKKNVHHEIDAGAPVGKELL
jgi:antitoxin MazE